ncbi:tRNA lysidine(34) synthetase TilS [Crateriforma conspicua]|uniref:tRNA lysidine(34) synthetase TilS n=1 Tax=Crateriforma conspicua TaxID=2527996 RepID=UPI0011880E37|nr:tRNA lysidine(34) synthetase TilS [Crateriforma conspicua]QDV63704.1 tRNA(Ile)-lysidine synthase [Crateriforma conspicua]
MSPPPQNHWDRLLAGVGQRWPASRWTDTGVVVGCSGGGDSVALLLALHTIQRQTGGSGFLVVAHFNHGLRGDASLGDAEFVADLANKLGLTLRSTAAGPGESVTDESTLRDQRMDFFHRVAADAGARYVALGHTRDDRVETFLHHLLRGSGPAGLCSLPAFRPLGHTPERNDFVIARPLLNLHRDQIRLALSEIDQPWREDASNQETEYTRNWIRHDVLPVLRQRFPQSDDAIVRAATTLESWQEVIDDSAQRWADRSIRCHPVMPDGPTIEIDACDPPATAVVVMAVQQAWDRLLWPRGGMKAMHWTAIDQQIRQGDAFLRAGKPQAHDPVVPALATVMLAGSVRLSRSGGHVRLVRPVP